jgi:putative intracellular protease/amidase
MNKGIYIYDEVEVLDFTGSFEVLTTAGHLFAHAHGSGSQSQMQYQRNSELLSGEAL